MFFEDLSTQGLADDVLARLLSFNTVIVTSHQGFFTQEAMSEIAKTTLGNVQAWLRHHDLPNEVCRRCDGSTIAVKTGSRSRRRQTAVST